MCTGIPKFTAFNVLKFMVELNKVFLQDTATMMLKHPERICNPLFRLEVFQSDEFQVTYCGLPWWHLMHLLIYLFQLFKTTVGLAIKNTGDSPLDSKLKAILPGVHHRLVVNQQPSFAFSKVATILWDLFVT
jgi:hypothetical protein